MSIFHLPLGGSQRNHSIFQMKKPVKNNGPLLPILLHSKAETRYVHGLGARPRARAELAPAPPPRGFTLHIPMNVM